MEDNVSVSEQIDRAMYTALERIRAKIAANIVEKGLRASGKTERSMRIEGDAYGMRLVGRPYFQSLELGRPAGRVPRGFNAIIRQWIINKHIAVPMVPYKRQPSDRWQPKYSVEERSLRLMAGRIAHTIATRGTLLHRQGGRADIYSPVIAEEVRRLQAEYVGIIVKSISRALGAQTHV